MPGNFEKTELVQKAIDVAYETVLSNHEQMTELDRVIGDGDHGVNMLRGFTALAEAKGTLSTGTFAESCKNAGIVLLKNVGGASGPLLASFFMSAGKAFEEVPQNHREWGVFFREGLEAVKSRGKADVGAKTMIDVLEPVTRALETGGISETRQLDLIALESCEATRELLATKGRAAFLGERSVGHVDPGAFSTALIICSMVNNLMEEV